MSNPDEEETSFLVLLIVFPQLMVGLKRHFYFLKTFWLHQIYKFKYFQSVAFSNRDGMDTVDSSVVLQLYWTD